MSLAKTLGCKHGLRVCETRATSLGCLNEGDHHTDNGEDEQNVDGRAEQVKPQPAKQPENEENNRNSPEHRLLSHAVSLMVVCLIERFANGFLKGVYKACHPSDRSR